MSKKLIFLFSLLIVLISGVVYLKTLSPTVDWIDSGELAVSCATLGISHPTGYPLYTLIGRVFSVIFCFNVIFGLNLLSLFLITFLNLFLFLIFSNLFQILFPSENRNFSTVFSFIATLTFAFTPTLWEQATSNEVYALNLFLASVVLFFTFFWYKTKFLEKKREVPERIFYLLVFLYALSFGNHMSTVLLFPALLFFFLVLLRSSFFKPKRLILGGSFFY